MKQTTENVEAVKEAFVSLAGKKVLAALVEQREELIERLLGAKAEDVEVLRGELRATDKLIKFIKQHTR